MIRERGIWITEDRALRVLFGPEREEVKWEWKRLGKEQLHNFYRETFSWR
jgi:hypothetical protein